MIDNKNMSLVFIPVLIFLFGAIYGGISVINELDGKCVNLSKKTVENLESQENFK